MIKKLIKEYNADNYEQALIGAKRYIQLKQIRNLHIEVEEICVDQFIAKIYDTQKGK